MSDLEVLEQLGPEKLLLERLRARGIAASWASCSDPRAGLLTELEALRQQDPGLDEKLAALPMDAL